MSPISINYRQNGYLVFISILACIIEVAILLSLLAKDLVELYKTPN
jgi:hypothetical protein